MGSAKCVCVCGGGGVWLHWGGGKGYNIHQYATMMALLLFC